MAKDNIDILLDDNGEDKVINGDYAIGDGTLDDCKIILGLVPGANKIDPIIGPAIIRLINSNTQPSDIKQLIKLHLNRDNKQPKKVDISNGNFNIEL